MRYRYSGVGGDGKGGRGGGLLVVVVAVPPLQGRSWVSVVPGRCLALALSTQLRQRRSVLNVLQDGAACCSA